jgi:Protein of unknown function (DUF3617)
MIAAQSAMELFMTLLLRPLAFAALGLIAAAPAFALDMPARKPGLWEIKMNFECIPGQTIQQCIDAETDQIMQSSASNIGSQNCSKRDIVKSGNTMTIDSVCSVAGRNATSHAVVTGSFDSAYTMTVASKSDVGPGINMTVAAKWLGPCQADQKPGDMIMPGGIKMNLRDLGNRIGVPGGAPGAPPR